MQPLFGLASTLNATKPTPRTILCKLGFHTWYITKARWKRDSRSLFYQERTERLHCIKCFLVKEKLINMWCELDDQCSLLKQEAI